MVTRMEEMNQLKKLLDVNWQREKKKEEKSMENVHTDVRT